MNTCIYGDCRETMRRLISEGVKVQMCVTSPPYFGLRDYGHPDQLGLERTPEEYVQHMVEVFSLVRELLNDDGTCWLNLGDSYWGGKGQSGQAWSTEHTDRNTLQKPYHQISGMKETRPLDGKHEIIKPKDLVGIPWRVAFALQADGWYLRSDIIWNKPNPMPESVTDRPTKAHEYLFLLSKNQRYYFDQEAVKEKSTDPESINGRRKRNPRQADTTGDKFIVQNIYKVSDPIPYKNIRSVWTIPTQPTPEAHFATFPEALIVPCIKAGSREGDTVLDPFFGSGTTGKVCIKLARKYIGCELQENYKPIIEKKTAQRGLL